MGPIEAQMHQEAIERKRRFFPPKSLPRRPRPVASLSIAGQMRLAHQIIEEAGDGLERTAAAVMRLRALALPTKPTSRSSVSVSTILGAVSAYYNVSVNDIVSARRTLAVVLPRQVAMYLAKTLTTRSLPDIGARIGNRDHTTVLHAVRKIGALIETDEALSQAVHLIADELLAAFPPPPMEEPSAAMEAAR